MTRPRGRGYIELVVDIDGIQIPASLREPKGKRATYSVRWKLGGQWHERTTGQTVLHEARRVGADIVRGKPVEIVGDGRLTVDDFMEVQEKHFANNAHKHKGDKSLKKFNTDFANFRRFFREVVRSTLEHAQQVTNEVGVRYLEWLQAEGYEPWGIHSKVASLRSAWNRVRKGHNKAKVGLIPINNMVASNPWEAIRPNMPELPVVEPIQLDLANGDFQKLHGAFSGRPVAQLFLIVSLWVAGRLEELSLAEWDWVAGDEYIDIPDSIAKRGKGRVVKIPPTVMSALKAQRVEGSPYIFAGFTEEYRRLSKRHAKRIRPFNPGTYDLICKHIASKADEVGLEDVTHHALRRTAMELSDQGEELSASDRSSRNLGTTTKNKEGFYIRKFHGRTAYLRADNLYAGLSQALSHFPEVAELVGVEKSKTDLDALLERVQGIGEAEREALLSALRNPPKDQQRRSG
jgi:integrase